MYLTVRDIRTKDDAKINLHLMLYFVLNDIDTMLDNTNDPIGEFMNAAGADMMYVFTVSPLRCRTLQLTA